jgi:hypothetical protein
LDQQVDQCVVSVRAEAEQVLVDRPAVVGRPVIDEPVLADLLPSFSLVSGTRLAGSSRRSPPGRWLVTKNQCRAMPRPATAFRPQPIVQNSSVPSAPLRPNSSQV